MVTDVQSWPKSDNLGPFLTAPLWPGTVHHWYSTSWSSTRIWLGSLTNDSGLMTTSFVINDFVVGVITPSNFSGLKLLSRPRNKFTEKKIQILYLPTWGARLALLTDRNLNPRSRFISRKETLKLDQLIFSHLLQLWSYCSPFFGHSLICLISVGKSAPLVCKSSDRTRSNSTGPLFGFIDSW